MKNLNSLMMEPHHINKTEPEIVEFIEMLYPNADLSTSSNRSNVPELQYKIHTLKLQKPLTYREMIMGERLLRLELGQQLKDFSYRVGDLFLVIKVA